MYYIITTMGNCFDCLLGRTRSALRHENLISHRQLTSMIRQSTLNDDKFYSSSNLVIVEEFLNSLNSNSKIKADFVHKNMDILRNFIQDLRDKYSETGRQYLQDQDNLRQRALEEHKGMIKNELVVLRVEVQVLLLGIVLHELIEDESDWELVLQISQDLCQMRKSQQIFKENSSFENENHDLMLSIKINLKQKQHQRQNISKKIHFQNGSNKNQSALLPTNITTINNANQNGDLIEIPVFRMGYKIVNRKSRLIFNLWKQKTNGRTAQIANKSRISNDASPQKLVGKNGIKSKMLIGQTSLSVSDFIYYNSLMISDVISLHYPNSIKSSVTTSASSSSQPAALISVRGQGIQGETFEKDYVRIIKQHQTVLQQMQLCLQSGEKAWEKLSLFRQSSQSKDSQKNLSIYSEYSMPQDNSSNLKYKL